MLSIVHFGKYYYPDRGGIESVTSTLAERTTAMGHRNAVVCFSKGCQSTSEMLHGVQVFRAATRLFVRSQPLGLQYFVTCIRLGRRADVIHVHYPNMLAALALLFVGMRPKVLAHWHSDIVNKGLLGWLVKPLQSFLLWRADVIVPATLAYALGSVPVSRHMRKVRPFPYGIGDPTQTLPRDAGELPDELAARVRGRKIVLAIGRLVPYKGFDVLIRGASELTNNVQVVIVGTGPLQASLQALVERLGVQDRVVLAGRLDDAQLARLFAVASIFCLPSVERSEAFGVAQIEAMAFGIPVVTTNIPGSGVPWVNQDGVSGINVAVGDHKALAEACNRILASDALRQKLSSGARLRFVSEFSDEVFVDRMLSTYGALTGEASLSRGEAGSRPAAS